MSETGEPVRYHPLFESDITDAADWYNGRVDGLGKSFAANVEKTVREVTSNPGRFPSVPEGLRYASIDRFPYIVLFDFIEDELYLMGVLHTARSIEKWRKSRD